MKVTYGVEKEKVIYGVAQEKVSYDEKENATDASPERVIYKVSVT